MIKFTTKHPDGKICIGLGLSDKNIKLLRQKKPIVVNLAELGLTFNAEIMIFTGTNEREMQKELSEFIGPDTVINS